MIHLNDHPDFQWAAYSETNPGFAKVCVGGEAFWLREVMPTDGDRYEARIDNHLVDDAHGLRFDDAVTFSPTEGVWVSSSSARSSRC